MYPDANIDFKAEMMQKIKNFVIDTCLSVKKQMIIPKRNYCFELFGYDFLVDEDLRIWLLEVNTNPYLGVANDFIKDLLPQMIDDMMNIVIDPLFPPKNKSERTHGSNLILIKLKINNYLFFKAENLFELLYSDGSTAANNYQYKNIR